MKASEHGGDTEVAAYLEANPDFFLRHPDLTARLRLPHGPAGTLSLVEHQMGLLRAQVEGERHLLAQLIARARENEGLADRLHQLAIQLILAPDRGTLEAILREGLRREFDTEAVSLTFPEAPKPKVALVGQTRCGPLDPVGAHTLFAATPDPIHSAALIPVRTPTQEGLLAIGSVDAARFAPDMGTEQLNRLGELVSACLTALERQGPGHG